MCVAAPLSVYVGVGVVQCVVRVLGNLTLDSPVPNRIEDASAASLDASDVTNVRVRLLNGSSLSIARGGLLKLVADTVIESTSASAAAIENEGGVLLLGQTQSIVGLQSRNLDFTRYYEVAALGSLSSKLVVAGVYQQSGQGLTAVVLNRTQQSEPVLFLSSDAHFGGVLNISFFTASSVHPDLYLEEYSGLSSSWSVVRYKYHAGDAPRFKIVVPDGLKFTTELLEGKRNAVQRLTVKRIGCAAVNTYYSGVPQDIASSSSSAYPCYICLQNSSCAICSSNNGQCGDIGSCKHGTKFKTDCCDGGCNGVYGNCHANDDHTKYTCRCTTIFYDGSHCDELTPASYAMIFSAVFLVLLLLLVAFFYRRARMQKKVVLEELADGLLNNNQNSGQNSAYIQSMQQALILNDVFVNYDEIKFEVKVGEGSFGEVHKATFRGAQVAVKKMRSMFAELTEREIEEFRKEAYVMSRWVRWSRLWRAVACCGDQVT